MNVHIVSVNGHGDGANDLEFGHEGALSNSLPGALHFQHIEPPNDGKAGPR